MRRWLIFKALTVKALTVLLLANAAATKAQEQYVVERARRYEPLILAAAERHGIDPRLLWAIAYQETRFRPGLVSPKGARGLMQFMPETALRYGLASPHEPAQAIDTAARYVRDLSKRFNGDLRLILAAYNSGEGTVEAYRTGRKLVLPTGKVINPLMIKTGGVPPYRETKEYVAGGIAVYRNLNSINGLGGNTGWAKTTILPAALPSESMLPEEPERSVYIISLPTSVVTTKESHDFSDGQQTTSREVPTKRLQGEQKTRSIYIR